MDPPSTKKAGYIVSLYEHEVVVVRAADAEMLSHPNVTMRLIAESNTTGGALGCHRVTLLNGMDGAAPHYHSNSSELFYVLDGALQVLAGEQVIVAETGDLVVVPAQLPHAFAAAHGRDADVLVVITPGVDRFGYFRLLDRLVRGEIGVETLIASQAEYDSYGLDSPQWRAARAVPATNATPR